MNTKKEYFELSKSVIKECQDRSHNLFKKTCDVLNVTSEEDKDILFDYLFNDDVIEKTQQTIDKYTENV
jgi:hypothetical protein